MDCKNDLDDVTQLSKLISESCRFKTPDSLQHKIKELTSWEDSLSPQNNDNKALLVGTHLIASILGILIFLGITQYTGNNSNPKNLLSAHTVSLTDENIFQIETSQTHTIKPWFGGKVEFSPPVYDFQDQGFPLRGARVDKINNHATAALVYTRRKHVINLFIDIRGDITKTEYNNWSKNGFNVSELRQGDFIYWAVSDLNATELSEFMKLLEQSNTASNRFY